MHGMSMGMRHINTSLVPFWLLVSAWNATYRSSADMFVCEICEVKAVDSNPVPMQVEEGIAFRLNRITNSIDQLATIDRDHVS